MTIAEYTEDGYTFKNFKYPHCGVYSQMRPTHMAIEKNQSMMGWDTRVEHQLSVATSQPCGNSSLWRDGICVYPDILFAEPNNDMPDYVKFLYTKASSIYIKSPRSACALLRLAVERLCNELGESGKIDTMIGNFIEKGLPTIVQKALDAIRVIGNKAFIPDRLPLMLTTNQQLKHS